MEGKVKKKKRKEKKRGEDVKRKGKKNWFINLNIKKVWKGRGHIYSFVKRRD